MPTLDSIDPSTGRVIARYERHSWPEIDARLERAAASFADWRDTDFADRAARLRALARRLRERAPAIAELLAAEMGKAARASAAAPTVDTWSNPRYGPYLDCPSFTVYGDWRSRTG